MVDLDSINIDELSLDEINELLPQIEVELDRAEQAEAQAKAEETFEMKPINERVEDRFSKVWTPILDNLTEEHLSFVQKEKEKFVLNEGMRIALERSIGPGHTTQFFKTLKKCVKKNSFHVNGAFYGKFGDEKVAQVAKVALSVYRLNLCKSEEDCKESSRAKRNIKDLLNSENPLIQTTLKDLTEVGLFPV